MNTFKKIIGEALYIFKKHPNTIVPFLIMGVMDFVVLYVVYLAPQRPVSIALAPPIRAFWGEQYLHYPMNLLLLPKLYNHAHMLLLATLGVLTSGCAIAMISEASSGNTPKLFSSFFLALKRYVSLLIIGVVVFLISFFLGKLSGKVAMPLSYGIYFLLIAVQIILLYAMIAVMVNKNNIIRALKRSFSLAAKHVIVTLAITVSAAVLYFPVILLKQNLSALITKFSPDIVVVVLGVGIIVVTIVDVVVTFLATQLFLRNNN